MADITLVLRDQFSNKANAIANANKGLSKSMEAVQKKAEACSKKVEALNSSLAKQQTQLQKTKKQLKTAEKAFADCADAANEEALTAAYQKYNALQDGIADTKRSAKETRDELRKLNDAAGRMNGGTALRHASGEHNSLLLVHLTNFIFRRFVLDFRPRLCYCSTDNKYGYRGATWN